MVQVLIVDDEKEIRNGLVTQIPWAQWGVADVFAADDGDTALNFVQQHQPDLIVTDVRMPRMSGIRLIEELVSNKFVGSFIVISGYDDFHYAKEAFKLGVSDYLLKPVSKEELRLAVEAFLRRLRENDARERHHIQMQLSLEQAMPRMREELLQSLIERAPANGSAGWVRHKLQQLKLDWLTIERLRLAIFGIDDLKALTDDKPPTEREIVLFAAGNVLEHDLAGQESGRFVLFRSRQDHWVVIFACEPGMTGDRWESVLAAASERVRQYAKVGVSIGFVRESGTIDRLHEMHRQAWETLVNRKVGGGAQGEAGAEPPAESGEAVLASPARLLELMKHGTEQDIQAAMAEYPKLVKSWQVHNPRDLQQSTFEWLFELFRAAKRSGWNESSWEEHPILLWEHLERFDTLESLQQQITFSLLEAAASMRKHFDSRSQIVFEAQRFILQRFQDNVTLQMAADHVHVTPYWLSKLFKKETGFNFLEYVTDVRLSKAAELLMDLSYKVYQISFLVGYQDPVHFSRLFKKKYSCTPQEYRNSRGFQRG